jgi:prepilin-type N-terminal cleavage/methylation domain-containing protein
MRRNGLSLIELLVAMGVMALAVALVVPGAGQQCSESRRLNEAGRLRLIGQLMFKYAANDPDGVLGPVHPEAEKFIGDGYAEYGGGPGTMPYGGWGQEFDPRSRIFNKYLYGQFPAATAPGDPAFFKEFLCTGNDLGWQDWQGFGTDPRETETPYFKGNGASFRMANLAFSDGTSMGIYGRAGNLVPVPSQTLAFFEARAYQTLFTNDTWGILEHGELTGYHGKLGFFNAMYADGHWNFADFGDGTYFEHDPSYNETDARGTFGRFDCNPEPLILGGANLQADADAPLPRWQTVPMQRSRK